MDSYSGQDKSKDSAGRPARPKANGTGNLNLDSFQSGTGALGGTGRLSTTRRLGTGALDVDKTLGAMATEVANGRVIVGKLEGRIAVLTRATHIMERPTEVNQICAGISAGEANFTKQVARVLQAEPDVLRRVRVALYQFQQAQTGLVKAEETLQQAEQYQDPAAKLHFVETHCHVEKLRGQLYPLINLHVVFKDHPLISQLIPTPKAAPVDDAPPPPPAQTELAARPQAGPIANSPLANDPAVREVVDAFNRVTGSLKDRFTGMLGLNKRPDKK